MTPELFYFQLFDTENHLNQDSSKYVFSTEGHILPIDKKFREKPWEEQTGTMGKPLVEEKQGPVIDVKPFNLTENVRIDYLPS